MLRETRDGSNEDKWRAKRITILVKGDQHFRGKLFTLNPHQTPEFDAFCDELTTRIPSNVGGRFKWVYTTDGRRITDIEQIEAGGEYIVSTRRGYDHISYKELPGPSRHGKHHRKNITNFEYRYAPVFHALQQQHRQKSGQALRQNEAIKGLLLSVSVNKRPEEGAKPINILKRKCPDLDAVKKEIESKLELPPIQQIFKVLNRGSGRDNFQLIHDVNELEHRDHLVVVPLRSGLLEPSLYPLHAQKNFSLGHANRALDQKPPFTSPLPTNYRHNKSLNKHSPLDSIRSSKGTGQPHRKTPREFDLDRDEGGVFRAKNQNNTRGAKQVKETQETKTERPIDQRKAEIVTEEEITNKEKDKPLPKGTQVNKKPSEDNDLTQKSPSGGKKGEMKTSNKAGNNSNDTTRAGVNKAQLDNRPSKKEDDPVDFPEHNGKDVSNGGAPIETSPPGSNTGKSKDGTKKSDMKDEDSEVKKEGDGESTKPQEKIGGDPQAASKIQAGFRGYETRKKAKAMKEERRQKADDDRRRQEEDEMRRQQAQREDEDRARQLSAKQREEAAVKIQSGFRGYKTRKEVKQNKVRAKSDTREQEAAVKIQAGYRGYQARKAANQRRLNKKTTDTDKAAAQKDSAELEAAATKIQAGFRGHKTRKDAKSRKETTKQTENQNNNRTPQTSKADEEAAAAAKQKEMEEAATRIQAGFKGYSTRKKATMKRKEEQLPSPAPATSKVDDAAAEQAATKIQAGFRGYQTRKLHNTAKVILMEDPESDSDQYPESARILSRNSKGQHTQRVQLSGYASRLQAAFRGYKVRVLVQIGLNRRETSVESIQAVSDSEGNDSDKNDYGAELGAPGGLVVGCTYADIMQSGFRGYKVRKMVKSKKADVCRTSSKATVRKSPTPIDGLNQRAAVQIQSAARAYMIRKAYTQKPSIHKDNRTSQTRSPSVNNSDSKMASDTIRSGFRGYFVRKRHLQTSHDNHATDRHKESQDLLSKKEAAAVKIQAHVRGYLVRRTHFAKRTSEQQHIQTREKAAIKIQTYFKGYLEHKANRSSAKSKHATVLQAAFSGYLSRARLLEKQNEARDLDKGMDAATKIQSAYRGYCVRSKYGSKPLDCHDDKQPNGTRRSGKESGTDDIFATKIQSACRGFTVRKLKRSKTTHPAATRLQSAFRGSICRKQFSLREKLESHNGGVSGPQKLIAKSLESGERSYWEHSNVKMVPKKSKHIFSTNPALFGEQQKWNSGNDMLLKASRKSPTFSHSNVTRVQAICFSCLTRLRFKQQSKRAVLVDVKSVSDDFHLDLKDDTPDGSSAKEIEKEGDSFREVEDDAEELKQIQKNSMVVLQLQAAFRSYQTRKYVNEVLNNKQMELDILKVDKAISNLLKKSDRLLGKGRIRQQADQYVISEAEEWEMDVLESKEQSVLNKPVAATALQAAFRAYKLRKQVQMRPLKLNKPVASSELFSQADRLHAAFRGYFVRKMHRALKTIPNKKPFSFCPPKESVHEDLKTQKAIDLPHSQIKKVQMIVGPQPPNFITVCTHLQAAFRGFKARKEYSSMAALVNSNFDSGALKMRSLSETDDMKLRLKSLSKIQAAFDGCRAKSGRIRRPIEKSGMGTGSRQQIYHEEPVSREVEISDLRRPLQPVEQSHIEGESTEHLEGEGPTRSSSVTSVRFTKGEHLGQSASSENSSSHSEGVHGEDTIQKGNRKSILRNLNRKRSEKGTEKNDEQEVQKSPEQKKVLDYDKSGTNVSVLATKEEKSINRTKNATPIAAERSVLEPKAIEAVASSGTEEEQVTSAIKIQSTYRGYRTRRQLKERQARRFDQEYEQWKEKRIHAATTIQSGWRGYKVRKDLQEQEDMLPDEFAEDGVPGKLLVINLVRTKEEIEQAEALQNAASMIQIVARASKKRRQVRVRSAVRRQQIGKTATALQAIFMAHVARQKVAEQKSLVMIKTALECHSYRQRLKKQEESASLIQVSYRKYRSTKERHAAQVIQSAFQSYKVRLDVENKLKTTALATRLQSACFAFIARRETAEKIRRNNATLLQAAFHGCLLRTEVSEKLKAMNRAATKLQAYFRGLLTRKIEYKRQKEVDRSATILQAAVLARKQRLAVINHKRLAVLKIQTAFSKYRSLKEENHRRGVAAVKIQSVFRGHRGRKTARKERLLALVHEEAIIITETIVNRAAGNLIERYKCAVRIQSAVRGFLARKRFARDKEARRQEDLRRQREKARRAAEEMQRIEAEKRKRIRNTAASFIQATFRGKQARDKQRLKQLDARQTQAAVKIQSLYRGFSLRKEMEQEKQELAMIRPPALSAGSERGQMKDEEMLQNARQIMARHKHATKLQETFRAYLTRKEIKSRLYRKFAISLSTPRKQTTHKVDKDLTFIQVEPILGHGLVGESEFAVPKKESRKKDLLHEAVTILQAVFRGRLVRRRIQKRRLRLQRERTSARLRRQHASASAISTVFRSSRKRKLNSVLRAEM